MVWTKHLFTFLCAVTMAIANLTSEEIEKQMMKECQAATGVNDADAKELMKNKLAQDSENQPHRCFVSCIMSKAGVMHEGNLNIDTLVDFTKPAYEESKLKFDEQKYRKGLTECNATSGEGKCMKSYKTWECYLKFTFKTMMKDSVTSGQ